MEFSRTLKYNLEFGGVGRSAFIDDNIFAAVETAGASRVNETTISLRSPFIQTTAYTPSVAGFVASADAIGANEVLFAGQTVSAENPDELDTPLPPAQKRAFCQTCDFLKWGAWGARVDYVKNSQQVTKDVPLGWWIAGDVISDSDSDVTKDKTKIATYAGDAIGNVNKNGQLYTATGGLDMTWNFGKRSGTLAITSFDTSVNNGQGLNLSANIARIPVGASSPNQFGGILLGDGITGVATGSFVRGPNNFDTNGIAIPKSIPQGVVGDWSASNATLRNPATYSVIGIFGGIKK